MIRPTISLKSILSLPGTVQCVNIEGPITVDLLIGMDFYWDLLSSHSIALDKGLMAQQSIFGWIISGPTGRADSSQVSHSMLCLNEASDRDVSRLWRLEEIGVSDTEQTPPDPIIEHFKQSVQLSDKRYTVSLPWKSDSLKSKLLSNETQARHRLLRLDQKLSKDPNLKEAYNKAIGEMEKEGIIREVNDGKNCSTAPVFYMPHRPVVRQQSVSTKVRPVFDASAKGPNGLSLNDCLETGPCLLPSLLEILIRFRRWKIALTADIQKAFLQICLNEEDKNVHRFLWNVNGKTRTMMFERLPFGNKSSPFLLNCTIKHHLSNYHPSAVLTELNENMYVDDWLSGADDELEACEMFADAYKIMSDAGFKLTKWASNSRVIYEKEYTNLNCTHQDLESVGVLGLSWNRVLDSFTFNGIPINSDTVVTKRVVLSCLSKLFDPLGILNPFMLTIKLLHQDLWKQHQGWDDQVSPQYCRVFQSWIFDLKELKAWQIPRRYTRLQWREVSKIEIHGFGDASERGYGCVVYIRMMDARKQWSSSFVISKSKVAPLKPVTLPRLELLGALLCAKMVTFVVKALHLQNAPYFCWTDSLVALSWIKQEPHRLKTFVANRVSHIHQITDPESWYHCPGKMNPADLVTRGVSAKELMTSEVWLNGPKFLQICSSVDRIFVQPETELSSVISAEMKSNAVLTGTQLAPPEASEHLFPVHRWGSIVKAVEVVAWVLRFIRCCRSKQRTFSTDGFSVEELKSAKTVLIRDVQYHSYSKEIDSLRDGGRIPKSSSIRKLNPFLGVDNVLRAKTRLEFAELSNMEVRPILIPKGHFGLLLARQSHLNHKHAGVNSMMVELRNQYWLIGARNICRKVKRQCISCQRQDSRPEQQVIAPLPASRVTPSPPFSVAALDHGGPLYSADHPGRKLYILLFTCATVRAIHLELVDSLSTDTTMLAFRRFVARRGQPSIIYSDNAKCFYGVSQRLLRLYGADAPAWHFIVPRAPWWGGFYERLVGTTKAALRKTIGNKSLTRVELETVLHEIEASVNSRPLTYMGDGIEGGTTITPSHFLIGRPFGTKQGNETAEALPLTSPEDLKVRLAHRGLTLERFWHVWVNEYIRNLNPFQGSPAHSKLKEGALVLIQNEHTPRLTWPLGIVVRLMKGRDGLVRSVQIRTTKGLLTRPIQRIYKLEIH